jgi:hypothetical protein
VLAIFLSSPFTTKTFQGPHSNSGALLRIIFKRHRKTEKVFCRKEDVCELLHFSWRKEREDFVTRDNKRMSSRSFKFSIDRGGTFTDIYCSIGNEKQGTNKQVVLKLLSEDPANYKDAPTEGIRRILEQVIIIEFCAHHSSCCIGNRNPTPKECSCRYFQN